MCWNFTITLQDGNESVEFPSAKFTRCSTAEHLIIVHAHVLPILIT